VGESTPSLSASLFSPCPRSRPAWDPQSGGRAVASLWLVLEQERVGLSQLLSGQESGGGHAPVATRARRDFFFFLWEF